MTETVDLFALERLRREAAALLPFYVCGVDEVGRGPVAGPIMAAAVILREDADLPGLNDSKKLTERRREMLYPLIIEQSIAWCVAEASVEEIETLGIVPANKLAMTRAVVGLSVSPHLVLVDGNADPGLAYPTECMIGGDRTCACIAAASIVAKVTRDRLMVSLAEQYPGYALEKHKGYGTALHLQRIRELGLTPLHRASFLTRVVSQGRPS